MGNSFKQIFCSHEWVQAHMPSLHYRLGYDTYQCLKCGKQIEFDPIIDNYTRQLGQKHGKTVPELKFGRPHIRTRPNRHVTARPH